jgi:hypothetical protein
MPHRVSGISFLGAPASHIGIFRLKRNCGDSGPPTGGTSSCARGPLRPDLFSTGRSRNYCRRRHPQNDCCLPWPSAPLRRHAAFSFGGLEFILAVWTPDRSIHWRSRRVPLGAGLCVRVRDSCLFRGCRSGSSSWVAFLGRWQSRRNRPRQRDHHNV